MKDLGTVDADQASISYAIADDGSVVGGSGSGFVDSFSPSHAFLWRKGEHSLPEAISSWREWRLI